MEWRWNFELKIHHTDLEEMLQIVLKNERMNIQYKGA